MLILSIYGWALIGKPGCSCSHFVDAEITNQGVVVGQFDMGDLKSVDADLGAVKDVIELPAR